MSCRSWRCNRWWRTPSGTGWPEAAAVRSRSSPATRAPTASITVEDDGVGMDPETLRSGHADALADAAGRATSAGPRRTDERRPSAARRVRQRLRPGGRDRGGRGHQGDHAGAQVPAGRPGQRRCGRYEAIDDGMRPEQRRPERRAGRRRRGARPRRAGLPAAAAPRRRRGPRRGDATAALRELKRGAPSTRCSSTSTCPGCRGLELAGVLAQFRRAARGGVRDRPRRQGGRGVRRRRRRLPAQADPAATGSTRRCAGRGDAGHRGAPSRPATLPSRTRT